MPRSHYQTLKLSHDATDAEVKTAFRQLVQKYHPDKFAGKAEIEMANVFLQDLNQAYAVLSDPLRRMEYDLSIGVQRMAKQAAGPASAFDLNQAWRGDTGRQQRQYRDAKQDDAKAGFAGRAAEPISFRAPRLTPKIKGHIYLAGAAPFLLALLLRHGPDHRIATIVAAIGLASLFSLAALAYIEHWLNNG